MHVRRADGGHLAGRWALYPHPPADGWVESEHELLDVLDAIRVAGTVYDWRIVEVSWLLDPVGTFRSLEDAFSTFRYIRERRGSLPTVLKFTP